MIHQKESPETNNSVKNYNRHLISAVKCISEKFKIKYRLWLSSYLLVGLFYSQGVMATQYATSLDCATANTVTEQVIFQDQKLASLDLQLAQEYEELVNNMKKVEIIKKISVISLSLRKNGKKRKSSAKVTVSV